MKVLILGAAESIFVLDYIRNILHGNKFEVYLTDTGNASKAYYDYYKTMGVKLIAIPKIKPCNKWIISRLQLLWHILSVRLSLMKFRPFDILHIHFVSKEKFYYVEPLLKRNTRLIASFWGSDLYRRSQNELLRYEKVLDQCDVITLSGKRMFDTFHNVFGNRFNDKIRSTLFGISTFLEIDKLKMTFEKDEAKKQLGINPATTVITIGYNRIEMQQHDKVLGVIKTLPNSILDKITLVLPFTYGDCSDNYRQSLFEILNEIHCEYKIIEGYQTSSNIAALRVSSDIFINAQVTDAFSASVQEYLYAGNLLINPKWLIYHELDAWGIYYRTYDVFEDLASIISNTIHDGLPDLKDNAKLLIEKTSWQAVRQSWLDIMMNNP